MIVAIPKDQTHCPPGLAKKGCVPPRQQKKGTPPGQRKKGYEVGDRLDLTRGAAGCIFFVDTPRS